MDVINCHAQFKYYSSIISCLIQFFFSNRTQEKNKDIQTAIKIKYPNTKSTFKKYFKLRENGLMHTLFNAFQTQ
jgi:hypothetical protein